MKYSIPSLQKQHNHLRWLYATAFLALLLSFVGGLLFGSTGISRRQMLSLGGEGFFSSPEGRILLYVRLPRTLASLVCGCGLAVAGAVIQNVLNNPLASPGIIGVNAGGGLAVTLCTAFGFLGGWQMSVAAFLGAFLAVTAVSLGARKWGASRSTVVLLGVALNSLLGAFSSTVTTLFPQVGVMSNDFKVGAFSAVTLEKVLPAGLLIGMGTIALLTLSKELEILTLGEDTAKSLGMNTALLRRIFLLLAALLAGCAVSLAGLLSFVGLMVPHCIRRLKVHSTFHLLCLSGLFGGAFVSICDTVSRTVFAPYELPVGILIAFLGVPFFVFLLINGKGVHRHG